MESSIAPHLRRPRTVPTRKGEDFTPPYPLFSARFPVSTTGVVMAYFGVQFPDGAPPPAAAERAVAELRDALAGPDGCGHLDRAEYVDEAGYRTRVTIAYWDDAAAHDRWAGAATGWTDPERAGQGVGFFSEIVRPPADRFETLTTADGLHGVSRLAEGLSDEVREHGYWGSARDRVPYAQDHDLTPSGTPELSDDGPLRTVCAGENTCLIRSGQDWTETVGEDRRMYLEDVEPHLRAGMEYLRDEGLPIGCYVNRYMTIMDEGWRPTERTFGLSWWHSMAELDTWAESHPTHLAIFQAALKYLAAMGAEAKLGLYHEVTVPARQETTFRYLDCHDRTGLLRAVTS